MTGFPVTVAITVYRRDRYLAAAVESALAQTVPVRVLVVDDAAPGVDHSALLRPFVERGVVHVRNPKTLGLVGNFNRCLELADTPWVSIFHDDDELRPDGIGRLLEAAARFPGRGIYFGVDDHMDEEGAIIRREPADGQVRLVDPLEFAYNTLFSFPGQMLDRVAALALGGFAPRLTMTSDWDLWLRLTLAHGGVRTGHTVALTRQYWNEGRATTALELTGYRLFAHARQFHRNFAYFRRAGLPAPAPDRRREWIAFHAQGSLADHAGELTPRGRRLYWLYARQAPPSGSGWRRAIFAVSPAFYSWLLTLYGRSKLPLRRWRLRARAR